MKSLSLFIFLGTLIALTIGGIAFVSPVFAAAPSTAASAPVAVEPQVIVQQPVAPLTGAAADLAVAPAAADLELAAEAEAGAALASTFTTNLSKAAPAELEQPVQAGESIQAVAPALDLSSFAASLTNGKAGQVTGIFAENTFAYKVGGQPNGNAAYVTETPGQVTRFGLAANYGSQAFLAHNYLAGSAFFKLSEGQTITLVHGDGSTREYRITGIRRFQALSPDSTQSRFVDLESGKEFSASSLFNKIYNSEHPVVLQTCIEKDGISTWGRMFILAVPVSG